MSSRLPYRCAKPPCLGKPKKFSKCEALNVSKSRAPCLAKQTNDAPTISRLEVGFMRANQWFFCFFKPDFFACKPAEPVRRDDGLRFCPPFRMGHAASHGAFCI